MAADLEPIARQIDRLVWAVGDRVRDQQSELPTSSKLESTTFGALLNLLPLRDHLTEALIRRRYIYRPEPAMTDFLANLAAEELVTTDGERLAPTAFLGSVADEVNEAIDVTTNGLWHQNEEQALEVSGMANDVLRAAQDHHGLVAVAQQLDDAPDPFHRCWQRLAGLRLVRNEAHVDAWQAFDLTPSDVEVLTGAWAETPLQGPVVHSENLAGRGYVADGLVTPEGLDLRRQIEDATDEGVRASFDAVDTTALLDKLRSLPPWD